MIMKGNKGGGLEKQKSRWAWLFIAPWIVGITVFFAVPMAQSVIYSFCNLTVSGNGFKTDFTGLSNYSYLFTKDTFFLQYLTGSVASVFPRVVMITAFSLLIAVVLKERFIGRSLARTVFFFPVIIASGVIISILQDKVMMSGSGVTDMSPGYMFKAPDLVAVFSELGLPEAVTKSITNIINSMFDLTWQSGVQILLLLSAINNIPSSFYEAAVMDGATAWEKFWKITFPTVTPTLLVSVIYTVIDGFTDYDNRVMQLLRSYYTNNNYTYSATIGVIYFFCILLIIGLIQLVSKRFVVYSGN